MLEFTRDGASGCPKAIVWTENEKKSCAQISMLTEIGVFTVRCFKHLPQVRSISADFCGELRRGIKLNPIYTQ